MNLAKSSNSRTESHNKRSKKSTKTVSENADPDGYINKSRSTKTTANSKTRDSSNSEKSAKKYEALKE